MKPFVLAVDLPPKELSPNGRFHRQEKARATADYRELVGFLAAAERNRMGWVAPKRARMSMVWGLARAPKGSCRPNDPDNAVGAAKALIDGLRDGRVIEDDSWAALELGSVTATFEDGPWVKVTVEAV